MKLLDILVEELVEWNDGIKYITQQANKSLTAFHGFAETPCVGMFLGGAVWRSDNGFIWRMLSKNVASDHLTSIITKQQWLEAKAQIHNKDVVWNGEGLPPVGVVCEVTCRYGITPKGEIRYVGDVVTVWVDKDTNNELSYPTSELKFSPIKTKEQLVKDKEKEHTIAQMYIALSNVEPENMKDIAEALYEAGYRKQ